MTLRSLVSLVVAGAGLAAVVFAFLVNASPYVTVSQAKTSHGNNLHLAGAIQRETLLSSSASRTVRFDLMDDDGGTMPVLYHGATPANLETATRVVAVGGMENGVFKAHDMLLKCPSKYEQKGPVIGVNPDSKKP